MGCPKAEKRFGSWSRRDMEKGAFQACVKIACVREGTGVCESLVYLANSKLRNVLPAGCQGPFNATVYSGELLWNQARLKF